MAKSPNIEAAIAKLAALKMLPRSAEASAELRKALASKVNYLAERAAQFISEFKLQDLAADLAKAFEFYASTSDSGCSTRIELAKALYEINANVPAVYLAGLRTRAGSRPLDPAAPLRGICIMGLVHIGHRDAMREATDMLADPAVPARLGAARALAMSGRHEAALVLRLKLHLGDPDPEVVGECLTAIMQVDPAESLPLVARFLDDEHESVAESAALALGESRRREALDLLRQHYAGLSNADARRAVLLAISLTRLPDAAPFLIEQLETCDLPTAGHALDALRIYRLDDALAEKIRAAVRKRNDPALSAQFDAAFT
ncbi:MAG TPA: HEAT repeat domain-containing protein [Tepidisphaeraceae bacterium]|jgi:HEAT repeat protein|nr:HEAT repeat domain-containing protein [Tepidisphaeraceae bacterium]